MKYWQMILAISENLIGHIKEEMIFKLYKLYDLWKIFGKVKFIETENALVFI